MAAIDGTWLDDLIGESSPTPEQIEATLKWWEKLEKVIPECIGSTYVYWDEKVKDGGTERD